ncbi:protein kinase [Streptomyces sp. NPDC051364]|uniref:protein kinase domain-containing protein n=1 Tax=Streptomyces sp. NPDC051364 TaxID=3155799 RepID=UPI0034155B9D
MILNPKAKTLVANRRGSSVWKVETGFGPYAVKVGYPSKTHTWTALAPAREAAVLRQLTPERILSAEWEHGTWNAQPWRNGDSLYELWEPHRFETSPPTPDLGEALSCAVALATLHEKGWVHGDVQPAHFVIGRSAGTFLIDLGLAQGGKVPREYDFSYHGCLVHYEAPEISGSVLRTGYAVPTRESDVYGLGASLFISATGSRHVDYPDDAERWEQRRAIVDKPHRDVNVPGVLGKLIEAMMSRRIADRPSSTEVCEELRAAM